MRCECVECGRLFMSERETEFCEVCELYLEEENITFTKFKKKVKSND